jgi:plasmid stabilization system protein ParE
VSLRLVVRRLAELDLAGAQRWYEAQRPGLGEEFRQTIDIQFSRILERPRAFPTVHGPVRRAVVRRFPYLLYFTLTADTVTVLACLHSKRDPGLLAARIKPLG